MEKLNSDDDIILSSAIAFLGDAKNFDQNARQAAESLGALIISEWNGEKFDVVVTPTESIAKNLSTLEQLTSVKGKRAANIIAVGPATPAAALQVGQLLERVSVFAWVESFESEEFQKQSLQALDEARTASQASASLAMYLEHNESLQRLSEELEARIEDRRNELSESTWRLQQSQRRSEIMHRALNAVHISHSIPEMERLLVQILHPMNHAASDAPNVEWVRIAFASQSRLESAPIDARAGSVFASPLGHDGHIHFGRSPEKPFRSDDRSFLAPIAEAVALAVTRLQSLERMEQIKSEWEETFNAIVSPVAVLDDQLRLVRGNRALLRGRAPEQIVGRSCFEAVFGRTLPCDGCPVMLDFTAGRLRNRGRNFTNAKARLFRISQMPFGIEDDRTFDVSSRPLHQIERRDGSLSDSSDSPLLVHVYRDATTTERFEKRIVESSKMAELGTIGSSIAHQLNNPIGGMLSHIQLLLMDLKTLTFKGKDELHSELKEMESGTRRCAEIVRDLLGFTRRGDEDEAHEHDLAEIVEQAIKITELQTRSRGIRFKLNLGDAPEGSLQVHGRFNLLAQAVRAVLLATLPSSLRDRQIEVQIAAHETKLEIRTEIDAAPSGLVDRPEEKLDLTVAEQILTEHGGSLELRKNSLVQQAILSLPRP